MSLNFTADKAPEITPDATEQPTTTRKRGRPRKDGAEPGSKPTPPPAGKRTPGTQTSIIDELKAAGEEVQEKTATEQAAAAPAQAPASNPAEWVSGQLLLLLCDTILPPLIAAIAKKRGVKVTAKQLRLTADEKKDLSELADEAAKVILPTMNPLTAFLLAMGAMYMSKIPQE